MQADDISVVSPSKFDHKSDNLSYALSKEGRNMLPMFSDPTDKVSDASEG